MALTCPYPECLTLCAGEGLRVVAMGGVGDCYCLEGLPHTSLLLVEEGHCGAACPGDPAIRCGGDSALHLFVAGQC